ncbi:hypothetical protein LX36DRAFT_242604 [Colletotrichum falcatum]|nr:hypothetical protein LX36DRAFT_242604 [Colletotrichum falcatum]
MRRPVQSRASCRDSPKGLRARGKQSLPWPTSLYSQTLTTTSRALDRNGGRDPITGNRQRCNSSSLSSLSSSSAKSITSPDRITQKISAPSGDAPPTPSARKHGPDRTSWPAGRT